MKIYLVVSNETEYGNIDEILAGYTSEEKANLKLAELIKEKGESPLYWFSVIDVEIEDPYKFFRRLARS